MNLEDESLLSSYLDGELDEVRRLAVEAALLARPRLAERLQDLTRVRSLVVGLARPTAPRDVSGAVVAEIVALGQLRAARRRRLVRRSLLVGPALAASALVAFGLGSWGRRPAPRAEGPRSANVAHRSRPATIPDRPAPEPLPTPAPRPEPPPEVAATPPPAAIEPFDSRAEVEERQAIAARSALADLLDQPAVRRIDVVVDAIGPDELKRVDEAIDRTARAAARHARVRICQEIAIDPKAPGEAVVYVMVLDGAELRRFRDRLEEQFPRHVGAPEKADPELVTRLADVGRLAIIEGTSAATLTEPPPDLPRHAALRAEVEPLDARADLRPSGLADPLRPPIAGRGRSAVVEAPRPPRGERRRRNRPGSEADGPTVYLVWLTTRAPAGHDRR